MKQTLCGWIRRGGRILVISSIVLLAGFQHSGGLAARDISPVSKALLAGQAGIAPGWVASWPDAQLSFSNMSQHALRLSPVDANHYPQIAYGGDHLYYAFQDSSGWHTQTVDSEWGVGSGAALALDTNGKAHISYFDMSNGDLKYATNKWGAWVIDTVVATGTVGRWSDIAIDAWGDPAIVYYDSTNSQLRYIYYDSEYGGWGPDVAIVTTGEVYHPGWFSLALDTSVTPNRPHVSYYEVYNNNMGYIEWAHYDNNSNWVHASVESSCIPEASVCKLGEYNSIALDPTNHYPSIAYSYYDGYSTDTIWYSSYNGSTWTDDYGVPAMDNPTFVSLGIDVSGYPHLTWNSSGLKYSHRGSGGNWTAVTTLDASLTAGKPVSLAVIGTTAKIAYYNEATTVLAYKDQYRGIWDPPVIIATQGHDVGSCTSLGMDRFGRANISYFDRTNHYLLYARYSGGAWTYNSIDSTGNASCYSVMIANPIDGDPTVAYINSGNLYYVVGNGTTWVSPLQVDSGVYPTYDYQAISMAIDSDGRPHMVYRKGTDVWYAVLVGVSWNKTLIASGTDSGYVALAIGPDKQPHVAYYQSSTLKYRRKNVSWQTAETIATSGSNGPGVGVALVVDQNGLPTVAFLNTGGTDLRASSRSVGGVWTISSMLDDNAEEYFSLVVDRSGNLHLATSALTPIGFQLDYISRTGGAWSKLAVDANNGNGWFPSISLSTSGMPRISYYDTYNHDLRFILKLDNLYLPLLEK